MIRVVVIASSPVVRAGLEALLREEPRFAVVPSAGAGPRGSPGRDARADVLLMEVASPDKVGNSRSSRQGDGPPTVILVDRLRPADLRHALHSGVRAILPRDATGPEIMAAIEGAAAGLTVLSSEEMDVLVPVPPEGMAAEIILDEALSARELEVFAMMAEGLGNKEIAARFNISEHTVKFHVSSILGKLGATTRGEAVARGIREGLITI
jgi:two-component system, NarL family, response regulator YdfI